jgi:cysteine sulfinate desulfinase/cysteine desulfurase-like protein
MRSSASSKPTESRTLLSTIPRRARSTALIAALGRAAQFALHDRSTDTQRILRLRDLFFDQLAQRMPGRVHLNGRPALRLPNTLNISIDGAAGNALLFATPGIAASTGSACHEGDTHSSPVLTAMGPPVERALSALRLALDHLRGRHVGRRSAHRCRDGPGLIVLNNARASTRRGADCPRGHGLSRQ